MKSLLLLLLLLGLQPKASLLSQPQTQFAHQPAAKEQLFGESHSCTQAESVEHQRPTQAGLPTDVAAQVQTDQHQSEQGQGFEQAA